MIPTHHKWRYTERLLAEQKGRCYWCDMPLLGAYQGPIIHRGLSPELRKQFGNLDHIIPRAKGGTDQISNVVVSCLPCNEAKADMSPAAWLKQLA